MTTDRPFGTALLGALFLVLLPPAAALADGEFFGLDSSGSSLGAVLSVSRGDLTYGAGYTDYGDGVSAGLSLTRRLPFDTGVGGLVISAGPSIGFGGGDLSEVSLGLTASVQHYRPTDFGNTFLQASYNTINRSYFTQAQIGFQDPGLTLALAHGASTEYEETSVSISKRFGDSPFSVRAGYRFVADEWFVGIAINTF